MELSVSQPLDLGASLMGGQAHRWKDHGDGWYSNVLQGDLVAIRQPAPDAIEFHSAPAPEPEMAGRLRRYLRLDDDIEAIYGDIIGRDGRLAEAVERYRGLRVLRQPPWECLVAYICSANNNIQRIHQNMESLAAEFGAPLTLHGWRRHTFPSPAALAQAGEGELRRLGLGFRAPYVAQAAAAVRDGALDLPQLVELPYAEAKAALLQCHGIGPKIADCIALFALEKLEAFPIDVHVRHALWQRYFPDEPKAPTERRLLPWAQEKFGAYAGYANQYLFHQDLKGG